jgi:hypothetical protein
MERSPIVENLLKNINNIHELGRQRAFELGNPFHYKHKGDGEYYRKELPNGEEFIVKVDVIMDENDTPIEIRDTIIAKLSK